MNEEKEYIKEHCNICKNRDTNLCHITRTIDNQIKCSEYEESKWDVAIVGKYPFCNKCNSPMDYCNDWRKKNEQIRNRICRY